MSNKKSLSNRIKKFGYKKLGFPRTARLMELEDSLATREDYVKYSDDSPEVERR